MITTTTIRRHGQTHASRARHPLSAPQGMRARRTFTPDRAAAQLRPQTADAHVRVVPLGGLEEVGRNMMYFEYADPASDQNGDIIVIDMGLQFPEENMPGIDYIVPNIQSLLPKRKRIKGVIITHAHYDHIGAIPHLMPELGRDIPLYATDLTLAIIKKRQEDFQPSKALNLNKIDTSTELKLGAFTAEFFGVSHNVPASVGVIIRTPLRTLVHT